MKQTIIYLEDEQHAALRKMAFDRHSSMTELVRQAIDGFLAKPKPVFPRTEVSVDQPMPIKFNPVPKPGKGRK